MQSSVDGNESMEYKNIIRPCCNASTTYNTSLNRVHLFLLLRAKNIVQEPLPNFANGAFVFVFEVIHKLTRTLPHCFSQGGEYFDRHFRCLVSVMYITHSTCTGRIHGRDLWLHLCLMALSVLVASCRCIQMRMLLQDSLRIVRLDVGQDGYANSCGL